jgi:hypothetical protein
MYGFKVFLKEYNMKKVNLLKFLMLSLTVSAYAQNVGIGTATPIDKLHVAGAANSVRIEGLSSTGTYIGTGTPLRAVFVDANGSLVRGGLGTPVMDAWYTIGNSGTTAGTNFIGTRDAQAFVTKTGGAAATNERMRILAGGTGVYNNITPFAGDVFSVYGTGYAGAINPLGAFAVSGYVGGNGTGIYGESNSGAAANQGIAVWGQLIGASTPTATTSYGALGRNTTTPAGTGLAIGAGGLATATSGDARGVNGQTASAAGIGVAGFNTAATGANAYGMYGQTASNQAIGIFGINNAAAIGANVATGIYGLTTGTLTSGISIGVRARSNATTGNGYGVYSEALSNAAIGGIAFVTSNGAGWQGQNAGTGVGVVGINTNATTTAAGAGVLGITNATVSMGGEFINSNGTGTGVFAVGNGLGGNYLPAGSGGAFTGATNGSVSFATTVNGSNGVIGVGNGVTPFSTVTAGSGVTGSGRQFGVVGFASTTVNTNPLNNANANAANASAGGYFEVQNAGTAQAWAYVGVREVAGAGGLRKIIGTGTVNTIVKDLNDNYVALSCPEAPENLFQDYGVGQLVNGRARIELDPILSKNIAVDERHPLKVFVQLEGDCNGVYVTNKSKNGFDVVELAGGNSNTSFSWSIVANRADEVLPDGSVSKYSEERFAPAPGPQSKTVHEAKTKASKENMIKEPLNDVNEMKLPQVTVDADRNK